MARAESALVAPRRRKSKAEIVHLRQPQRSWVAVMVATVIGVGLMVVYFGPTPFLLPTMFMAVVGALWSLVVWDRYAVVLGSDGVLVRQGLSSCFVTYHHIRAVRHLPPDSREHNEPSWALVLELSHGPALRIATASDARGAGDPLGKRLARAISRAIRRARGGTYAHQLHLLERGGRSGRDWLAQLRELQRRVGTPFRSELNREQLWTVLRDDGAELSCRAGAAVVLGSPEAFRRLARSARRFANPRIKKALRALADAGHSDAELSRALEEVSE